MEQLTRFLHDNFAPWVIDLGLHVTGSDAGSVQMRLPAAPRLDRVGQVLCGQALAAAADTAMVLAVVAARGAGITPGTVDLATSFIRPAIGCDVLIRAEVLQAGRTLAFCRAELTSSGTGKLLASATATYVLGAAPGSA